MIILKIIGFITLALAVFALVTYVFMRVWNWLVPTTFNGPRLRFVQALAMLFLARVLFGGFGHGGVGWRSEYASRWSPNHHRFFDHRNGERQSRQGLKPVPPTPDPAAPTK